MNRHDAERIWELVGRHYRYTGSTRAKAILDHWDADPSQKTIGNCRCCS